MDERLTKRHLTQTGLVYRVLAESVDKAVHLLGQYEDLGTVSELAALKAERDEYRECIEDMTRQFAYQGNTKKGAAYLTGGLSALETAFSLLGWDDPKPAPECECSADGCHEWAGCGMPTQKGYKWLCSKHAQEYRAKEAQNG